ncbi:hypothetical protein BE21_58100 [Sorangium cellulosum]|uniref:Secreted protein n=1 Tax=Sorangium cellulosum TaxID=56 RepID=A0A150U2V6_SORCE|nr:hypothetical protein BE21_58100 [Sorangium cellulosum]
MKSRFPTCSILLVASLLSLSACGDDGGDSDGGGAACGEFAACGGDPTGSWTIEETCLDPSMFAELTETCDATIDISGVEMVGTAEFKPDSTYVTTSTMEGPMKIVYPPSCLTMEGVTITCAQLDATMQELLAQGIATFTSASCVAAGAGCACTLVLGETTTTGAGTWSVSGSSLTVQADGEAAQEVPFCVEGSSLTMAIQAGEEGGAPGTGKSYMRLTKQ